ncbi:MAG: hypothetical protein WCK00_13905 [Deltaproteobacteria bacterium]
MKKLMTALAVCAAASISLAASGVTSANVVGYTTTPLTNAQYTALGWQFTVVGSGSLLVPIASLTNYPNPTVSTLGFSAADGIRKWRPLTSDYQNYYRRSASIWAKAGETTNTTDTISAGEMVMFIKRGTQPSSLMEIGEVSKNDIAISTPKGQYTAMCNPFPTAIPIASITNYPNPTVSTLGFSAADGIRKWVPQTSGYQNYYRRSSSIWAKAGETTNTTDVIAANEGFMFIKRGTTDGVQVTFTSPIK